jgi:hypothetical protein
MTSYVEVSRSIDKIHAAMRVHLDALQAETTPPELIARGEEVVQAVLEYERLLGDAYGWSNPIRHLGPPLTQHIEAQSEPEGPAKGTQFVIAITQHVEVLDSSTFPSEVQARFGDARALGLTSAVRRIVEAEAWRPTRREGMEVRTTNVDIRPREV